MARKKKVVETVIKPADIGKTETYVDASVKVDDKTIKAEVSTEVVNEMKKIGVDAVAEVKEAIKETVSKVEPFKSSASTLADDLKTLINKLQVKDENWREPAYELKVPQKDMPNFLGWKVVLDDTVEPGTVKIVAPNGEKLVVWYK